MSVLTQLSVWIMTVAVLLGLGVLSMGVFFGFGAPPTWMITLSVIIVSCVGASEDADCVDETVMVATTR